MTLTSSLRLGVSFSFGPWTLSTPQCGGVGPPPERVSDFSFRAFALHTYMYVDTHTTPHSSRNDVSELNRCLFLRFFLYIACLTSDIYTNEKDIMSFAVVMASKRAGRMAATHRGAGSTFRHQGLLRQDQFFSTSTTNPLGWIWNQVKVPKGATSW
jgi:hypothetical protein